MEWCLVETPLEIPNGLIEFALVLVGVSLQPWKCSFSLVIILISIFIIIIIITIIIIIIIIFVNWMIFIRFAC